MRPLLGAYVIGAISTVSVAAPAVALGANPSQFPVPLGPCANARLEAGSPIGFGAPSIGSNGSFLLNEIPFYHSSQDYAWNAHVAAPNGGQASMMLIMDPPIEPPPLPIPSAWSIDVFTQINTYWGTTQPHARLRFHFNDGLIQAHNLIGNMHVRDYANHSWTNSLSSQDSAEGMVWGCDGGAPEFRMDTQRWPVTLQVGQTLTAIEFIDDGAPNCCRLVVGGVYVVVEYEFGSGCSYPSWPQRCKECPGDFGGDEVVDAQDLAALLSHWGERRPDLCSPFPFGDIDHSGEVDAGDLAAVLGSWGYCPM